MEGAAAGAARKDGVDADDRGAGTGPAPGGGEGGDGQHALDFLGVLLAAWGLYAAVFVGLLAGRSEWLILHLLPVLRRAMTVCGFVIVPAALVLALPSRTRLVSGLAFVTVSNVFTFATCAFAAIYTYTTWSWPALVLGTLLVGYGILPVAAVSAAVHHQPYVAGQVGSGAVMLFGCLYFGLVLISMAVSTHTPPHKRMPSDIDLPE